MPTKGWNKLTPARVEIIATAIGRGCSRVAAAKLAGVSPSAYHVWIKQGKERIEAGDEDDVRATLVRRVRQAEGDYEDFLTGQLSTLQGRLHFGAIAFGLERRCGWAKPQHVIVSMADQEKGGEDRINRIRESAAIAGLLDADGYDDLGDGGSREPEKELVDEPATPTQEDRMATAKQKRISAKIAKLIREEGKSPQQAAAIAHSLDKEGRLGPRGGTLRKKRKK